MTAERCKPNRTPHRGTEKNLTDQENSSASGHHGPQRD